MTGASVIALDVMSGDLGAAVVVRAAAEALGKYPDVELILVGDREVVEPLVRTHVADTRRLQLRHAEQVVAMTDAPADAVRKKKNSSMRIAIDLVKAGEAQACVSAGNTGALMATAKFVLKTLPGIDRPAILAELPSIDGSVHMLDLGANTSASAEQLFQFALMGSIVASDIARVERPRVALLNIGAEDVKGNDVVREAAGLLSASTLNYVGFVEGTDIFRGRADVVVTDGFTGNVALKTMEGTAALIRHYMRQAFTASLFRKLLAGIALPALRALKADTDSRRYNGATLVGLNGIVIKSHGSADEVAFLHAIENAVVEVENQVPQQIGNLLAREAA
jgi:glycerol-3-phosphate acyltransferase PlsX